MKRLGFGLLFLTTLFTGASAQEARVVLASVQPFAECVQTTYSPEVRSGCYVVPKPSERFTGTKDHPAVVGWNLPPKEVQDKVFPKLPTSLQPRPVLRGQVRRLVASKHCANCKFVSKQSALGKQLSRQYARQMGVQAASMVVGFLVPYPFSILASTLVCGAVQTSFDAKEYREDYKQEPTQEQYSKSFGENSFYCSPVGGIATAINNKNPLQFIVAGLGFSSYFVNLPPAVGYLQQASPLVEHAAKHANTTRVAKR